MTKLTCLGRDGVVRTFRYVVEQELGGKEWHFRVFSCPAPSSGNFFELAVTSCDDKTVRVVAMAHHHDPAYVAMGIPDALLPAVRRDLGRGVISSPTEGPVGVWRTSSATKVWERLRAQRLAVYDVAADVYKLL